MFNLLNAMRDTLVKILTFKVKKNEDFKNTKWIIWSKHVNFFIYIIVVSINFLTCLLVCRIFYPLAGF